MNITIVGSGYVGLVSGACFSELGNNVICIDSNKEKIDNLNRGIVPIFEPGLEELIERNKRNGNLFFSVDLESAINKSEIVFIAVGTPMGEDGSADLQYVLSVAKSIGELMMHRLIIVDKSTVPVGTGEKVRKVVQNELDLRNSALQFDVVSNPEFLKEGVAIYDFMKPDRVVIGTDSDYALGMLKKLYDPFCRSNDRFIHMDIRSAEMTKYAANAMLATKISFINEMANICEHVGADANKVRIGIGSDKRIGFSFIYPGVGYGGSCFPKDIKALINVAELNNYHPKLIRAVEEVNEIQKSIIVKKILDRFGNNLSGLTFGIWGLSFKPETDDMRQAPSINVIKDLLSLGSKVKVYDPKAMNEAKVHYLRGLEHVEYCESKYKVLNGSNALILLTEWKEFRSPDFKRIKSELKQSIIFDGRNQYSSMELKEEGFEYFQIGKKDFSDQTN